MNQIYILIGKIIENAQYIEWNLALMLRYHMILSAFDNNHTISLSQFEQSLKNAEELSEELQKMTLGEIIFKFKEINKLNQEELTVLENVLRTRNYLVHQYFKKHDFNNEQTKPIIEKELIYLNNTLNKMHEVNVKLANIIGEQIKQYESIH